jgi:hypothetical protein
MSWQKAWPKVWAAAATCAVDVVSGSTEQIRANWKAIEDWTKKGHYNMDNVTSAGAHVLGQVGTLAVSSTSQIATISAPGTGAWAWDTTKGELQILTSGGVWESATASAFSRVRKVHTGISIPDSIWTSVPWYDSTAQRTYDGLSEFGSYTVFTAINAGYYLVRASAHWAAATTDYQKAIGIFNGAYATAIGRRFSRWKRTTSVVDVVQMAVGDQLSIKCWQNSGVASSIDEAKLSITRLS